MVANKFNLTSMSKLQKNHKKILFVGLCIVSIIFIAIKPQSFVDLWLTKDQQGQLLFNHGNYQKASQTFSNTEWQAFSAYGNEDFNMASSLYSQSNKKERRLYQANALAHARQYIKARDLYQNILSEHPDYNEAKQNRDIVQAIIDEVNRLSEAQQPEQGESIKELGDEPQTGDGAEKQEARKQKVEQLSSEQLLQDPSLNEMWLRQVQKDPASFLSQKFYFQHEANRKNKGGTNEK